MTILIIADHDNDVLKPGTLNTLTAAQQLGGDIDVLVAGRHAETVAADVARYRGVQRVWHAESDQLAQGLAEPLSDLIVALAKAYSHVLFTASVAGKSVAPRVAALLDVAQISDVIAIEAPDTFRHPIYAGNAIETVRSKDAIVVATIRPTAFEPATLAQGPAPIVPIDTPVCAIDSQFISRNVLVSDRPDLAVAKTVVAGGRGLGSAEAFKTLDPLAEKLGAALGASRAAVDAGYAPNDWQVGQTGKVVAPELYIAVGISGAIQHLAGMKDSKTIVAINKDADAPIFGVANYGLVADLFDAVPTLTQSL